MKYLSVNINGLRGKRADFEILLHDNKPDIILIQEPMLDGSVSNCELFPPCFSIPNRKDRDEHEGGVLIAYRRVS